jgi:N-acetyl sugar amidotransferase
MNRFYCRNCVLPSSKPDLHFDSSGLCSACQAFDARALIDWNERQKQFQHLVVETHREARDRGAAYDCVVPVSGGKDSHAQVLKALDYGLKVLAVTAETDHLSAIGRRNLDNIAKLGVDHIEIKTNPVIRRRINRFTLETIGDISWAEHITIFSIPVRIAAMMNIPLIIWGENSQNEYGGPEQAQLATNLTQDWLNEFGGLNGLRVADVEAVLGPIGELYQYPDLSNDPPKGIFLGQFFPWSGYENALFALEHGFEWSVEPVEMSGFRWENLDNAQTGIHDRFKWLKFGFGRATDICSNLIRRHIMTRELAIEHVKKWDGNFPITYLGVSIATILREIGMTGDEYLEVESNFTDRDLFDIGVDGVAVPKFEVS